MELHTGDHVTWTHSSGKEVGLDYFAVDHPLRISGAKTQIATYTIVEKDHGLVL